MNEAYQLLDLVSGNLAGDYDSIDDALGRACQGVAPLLAFPIAVKTTWIESSQARPFADLLDDAMGALNPA